MRLLGLFFLVLILSSASLQAQNETPAATASEVSSSPYVLAVEIPDGDNRLDPAGSTYNPFNFGIRDNPDSPNFTLVRWHLIGQVPSRDPKMPNTWVDKDMTGLVSAENEEVFFISTDYPNLRIPVGKLVGKPQTVLVTEKMEAVHFDETKSKFDKVTRWSIQTFIPYGDAPEHLSPAAPARMEVHQDISSAQARCNEAFKAAKTAREQAEAAIRVKRAAPSPVKDTRAVGRSTAFEPPAPPTVKAAN